MRDMTQLENVKNKYPDEFQNYVVFHERVDSLMIKHSYDYDGSDFPVERLVYKIEAGGQIFDLYPTNEDFNTKEPILKGDTVYIIKLYDGYCRISKQPFSEEQIEELNSLSVIGKKRAWLLSILIYISVMALIGTGTSFNEIRNIYR